MKKWICLLFLLLVLTGEARAAEVPKDLTDALPEAAEDMLEIGDLSGPEGFSQGLAGIAERVSEEVKAVLRQRIRGAASILLVAVACGAVDGFARGTGEGKAAAFLPMAGALAVTLLTAGSLEDLIGLGAETIRELNVFSKALLPTLAAATAASGAVTTATFQQVTTVFLADLLMELIDGLLIPMVYLYIGALAAGACLPENRLGAIAEALKKIVTWILTTSLLLFTVYLSTVRVGGRGLGEGGQGRHLRRGAGGGGDHRRGGGDRPSRGGNAEKHHRRLWDAGDSGGLRLSVFAIGGAVPAVQAFRLPGGGGGRPGSM